MLEVAQTGGPDHCRTQRGGGTFGTDEFGVNCNSNMRYSAFGHLEHHFGRRTMTDNSDGLATASMHVPVLAPSPCYSLFRRIGNFLWTP
jgi:hypothetical protein